MEGMAVSASAGVMKSILFKLSVLLSDQYKQLKGVRKDIGFLSRELTDMNAVLERLADMEKLDAQAKVWKNNVREMAFDVEDCIDVFMHNLGQGDDKDGLFCKMASKIRKLRVRYQIVNKIRELKVHVLEQSERRDRYKIDEFASRSTVVEIDPRIQSLFEDTNRLVGIEGPRKEIISLLTKWDDSSSRNLKVVSIVGFGGLGKTTLANEVYKTIKNEFDCRAFVSLSRNPIMQRILKDVLSEVGHYGIEIPEDEQKLISAIRKQLLDKRYLIIVDDIWNIQAWDILKWAFVPSNNGSRVITTTRIQDVAAACCQAFPGQVYQMQPLNKLDSRRLFFKRVFNTEDRCPQQLRAISEDMLRKCKGVPLAITSIASLLASHGNMHTEKWELIRNSLPSELGSNPTLEWMTHVLTLSYNDLSPDLKTCLLYLGTYPEDYEISKVDLVRRWIGEGFVSGKYGLDLEDVAENYFNELINRSMIQPSAYDLDEVRSCKVHDLMLDFIIVKCMEENFISIIDRQYNTANASQVRRICHQFNNENISLEVERINLSHVRSYTFFPTAQCMLPFSRFELLRVLDLHLRSYATTKSESLDISSISHLFLLRYLKVAGFRFMLPQKLGKLQNLMTLDIVENLPCCSKPSLNVTSLSSLRHLMLPYLPSGIELFNGLSKLRNLRILKNFDIGKNSLDCIRDLGLLTNLTELQPMYTCGDKEEDSETIVLKYDLLAASLSKIGNSNLRYLEWDHGAACAPPVQFWSSCFKCPRHLRRLLLHYLKMPHVPKWMVHAESLVYLDALIVKDLWSEGVNVLANLPCLLYLCLEAERIPEKKIIINPNGFPRLKEFKYRCMLSTLLFEPRAMPQVRRLSMSFDGRVGGVVQRGSPIVGIENLPSLEDISVIIRAKHSMMSKIRPACRDAINRHPRADAININLNAVVEEEAEDVDEEDY